MKAIPGLMSSSRFGPGAIGESLEVPHGIPGWHTCNSAIWTKPSKALRRRAYDPDLPTIYDRANVVWFWSIVAERRGEHGSAAVLLGFADALSEKTSVRLKAFDLQLVEASRSALSKALGEKAFGDLLGQGATMAWEDLPLVHQ